MATVIGIRLHFGGGSGGGEWLQSLASRLHFEGGSGGGEWLQSLASDYKHDTLNVDSRRPTIHLRK